MSEATIGLEAQALRVLRLKSFSFQGSSALSMSTLERSYSDFDLGGDVRSLHWIHWVEAQPQNKFKRHDQECQARIRNMQYEAATPKLKVEQQSYSL